MQRCRFVATCLLPTKRCSALLAHFPTRRFISESPSPLKVKKAVKRIAAELDGQGIDYCIVGGNALNAHGYLRATRDVDVLVTKDGLDKFKQKLVGKGYNRRFKNAQASFVDSGNEVDIDFFLAGEYPGDRKPKEISFPEPSKVSWKLDDVKFINLADLINLKLASAQSLKHRLKDKVDVLELIKTAKLTKEFADQLNPSVRDLFLELTELEESADE